MHMLCHRSSRTHINTRPCTPWCHNYKFKMTLVQHYNNRVVTSMIIRKWHKETLLSLLWLISFLSNGTFSLCGWVSIEPLSVQDLDGLWLLVDCNGRGSFTRRKKKSSVSLFVRETKQSVICQYFRKETWKVWAPPTHLKCVTFSHI